MSNLYAWKREHFKWVPKEMEKKRALLASLQDATDAESMTAREGLRGRWMNYYTEKKLCGCNGLVLPGCVKGIEIPNSFIGEPPGGKRRTRSGS
jgi:hypothetical protein